MCRGIGSLEGKAWASKARSLLNVQSCFPGENEAGYPALSRDLQGIPCVVVILQMCMYKISIYDVCIHEYRSGSP